MPELPNCPKCDSEYTYEDGSVFMCPDCGHEFTAADTVKEEVSDDFSGVATGSL